MKELRLDFMSLLVGIAGAVAYLTVIAAALYLGYAFGDVVDWALDGLR